MSDTRYTYLLPGPPAHSQWLVLKGTHVGTTYEGADHFTNYYVTDHGSLVIWHYGGEIEGGWDDPGYIESIALALLDQGERDVALRIIDLTGVSPEVPL